MKSRFLHLTVLLTFCLLSGCGFALRGSVNLPPELATLYLESTNQGSDIMQEMRRALLASDINLLDQPQSGIYRLELGDGQSQERVLSVNSAARAGEYELSLSVPVQLRTGETLVFGPEILTIEKSYLADPDNAVAKAEERELMEGEMRQELVSQILRRLQSLPL